MALSKRLKSFSHLTDQVFNIVLFYSAVYHVQSIIHQSGVDSVPDMGLSLLLQLAADDALPDCPEEVESPESQIIEDFLSFELVENCSLLVTFPS